MPHFAKYKYLTRINLNGDLTSGIFTSAETTVKPRLQNKRKSSSGYCECCDTTYRDGLQSHLSGYRHRMFVLPNSNCQKLDDLIDDLTCDFRAFQCDDSNTPTVPQKLVDYSDTDSFNESDQVKLAEFWVLFFRQYKFCDVCYSVYYQRDSIASYASAGIAVAKMSVHLPITVQYCIKTNKARIAIPSPTDSPKTYFLKISGSSQNSKGVTPNYGFEKRTLLGCTVHCSNVLF